MKVVLYGIVVACFMIAGVLDAWDGDWKTAAIAWMLGTVNALIFLWR